MRPSSPRARCWRAPRCTGRAGGPGALLRAGAGRSCHAERAPPQRAPVRALRRLPPELGDRRGLLPLLQRDASARRGRAHRAPRAPFTAEWRLRRR
jgi:hypothetical protein